MGGLDGCVAPAADELARQQDVGLRAGAGIVVDQHRHAVRRCLGDAHVARDGRAEHQLAEMRAHIGLDLLARRGIRFRRLTPSSYGRELNDLVRKQEPQRAVDRLLVAGLIEARSCERFHALAEHVQDLVLAAQQAPLSDDVRAEMESMFAPQAQHLAFYRGGS